VNVRELCVSRNRLSSLPESLGAMRRLARLDCRENQIRAIPASIEACASLAELYLGRNRLATIPDELGRVASLRTLDVSCNALKELRPSLANVPLSLLDASGASYLQTFFTHRHRCQHVIARVGPSLSTDR
jgi:Leucine-rich repeat (LRR) protein